jgi:Fic family protein
MQVISGIPGRERVHFEAPGAERIPQEMDMFFTWFNSTPTTCPVIKAAIGHLWFVTIHPFEDGNGRIARAIAEMLLARADGTQQRFYSMSAQIESERATYYEILEKTQKGSLDLTPWLSWFIGSLDRSLDRAQNTLNRVLFKAAMWRAIDNTRINDRQRKVVNRLIDGFEGFLTSSKYAKMTKCSHDTALRDIKELLAHGIVLQNEGQGRSVNYRLGSPESIENKQSQP